MTFECLGVDLGGDDCFLDSVIEVMDLDEAAEASEFVEAEASLDAGDRERIAEAGLRCQGASAEVAACVTDAMRDEFGDAVFEVANRSWAFSRRATTDRGLDHRCSTADTIEPPDPGAVPSGLRVLHALHRRGMVRGRPCCLCAGAHCTSCSGCPGAQRP